MPVYVDRLFGHGGSATFKWTESCHMFADTLAELHAFAASIGLKRSWFQVSRTGFPHYDLTKGKRIEAVNRGAITIKSRKALIRKFNELRCSALAERDFPKRTKAFFDQSGNRTGY